MSLSEFALIEFFFKSKQTPCAETHLSIGDDAALLNVAAHSRLVVSADTLVSGVHFFEDVDPQDLGHKALAVNLSDLAAMGATPKWFTLCLTLPKVDEDWLASFTQGLFALADLHQVHLVGGDTTKGPLSVTIQAMGLLPDTAAGLLRSGALINDEVWVSGQLGEAALGLYLKKDTSVLNELNLSKQQQHFLLTRLNKPTPRCDLGQALLGLANSAVDISDGLLQDLSHLCNASGVGADIDLKALPSRYLSQVSPKQQNLFERVSSAVLCGGDDYELCFTAPKKQHAELKNLGHQLKLSLSCIGKIVKQPGVQVHGLASSNSPLIHKGYEHTWKE